jgi:hypothetical protein
MVSCWHVCDNSCMDPFDPETPRPPSTPDDVQPPGRSVRRFGRGFGWTAAVVAVPLGIALSWVTAWVGNCKLGFFGETGPDIGAGSFTLSDLGAQSIGWLVAVVPWLIIARWNRDSDRRRVAGLVAIGASVVIVVVVMLPQLGGIAYWEQVCT